MTAFDLDAWHAAMTADRDQQISEGVDPAVLYQPREVSAQVPGTTGR